MTPERKEQIRQFLSQPGDWLFRDGESALTYARELFTALDYLMRAKPDYRALLKKYMRSWSYYEGCDGLAHFPAVGAPEMLTPEDKEELFRLAQENDNDEASEVRSTTHPYEIITP